ncbi:LOW QUALITY PROTEIN: hypothetical protein V2J09_021295 [Rumex salicifolius]
MKFLLWNCCSAGKASFERAAKYLIRKHKIDLLVVFETQLSRARAKRAAEALRWGSLLIVNMEGRAGGIWLLWDPSEIVLGDSLKFIFSYAPPTVHRRVSFWAAMKSEIEATSGPVFLGGDLNCILRIDERQAGSGLLHNDLPTFKSIVEDCGLLDLVFYGQNFTWSSDSRPGNYVAKRLDRVVMCIDAFAQWPNTLPYVISPSFARTIVLCYSILNRGGGLIGLGFPSGWRLCGLPIRSLKTLSGTHGITRTRRLGLWICSTRSKPRSTLTLRRACGFARQVKLADVVLQEESLWKQKSRECWLRDGDRNTSLFHLSTIIRRKRNRVKALKDDGNNWIYDPAALERLVVEFLRDLYSIPQHELFPIVMRHNGFPLFIRIDERL